MNIGDVTKTILAAIGALGSAAVIVGGIAAWLGKIWADKLYLKDSANRQKEVEEFKNQYTTQLEQLRAEMTERRDTLNTALTAMTNGYAASQERIITAMEELWKTVREIQAFVSPYIHFYQILLPEEYENVPIDNVLKIIPSLSRREFDLKSISLGQALEDKRPFMGESLWFLFWIYRAFATRQAVKVVIGRDNKKLYQWNKDEYGKEDSLVGLLLYVFTQQELDAVIGGPIEIGIPQRIMDALERKILGEMNEWIFGKRLLDMSIEEQERVANLLPPIRGK